MATLSSTCSNRAGSCTDLCLKILSWNRELISFCLSLVVIIGLLAIDIRPSFIFVYSHSPFLLADFLGGELMNSNKKQLSVFSECIEHEPR